MMKTEGNVYYYIMLNKVKHYFYYILIKDIGRLKTIKPKKKAKDDKTKKKTGRRPYR